MDPPFLYLILAPRILPLSIVGSQSVKEELRGLKPNSAGFI